MQTVPFSVLAEISGEYERLRNAPRNDGSFRQRRGFAFERMLKSLLEAYGLQPRGAYKPDGEQIDGSFMFHGRVYLIEAKWVAQPVPASELYSFKGKVDGKLAGTLGVFISMSGYSSDAVTALIAGKGVNLILFDRSDWELSLDPKAGFVEVLSRKLRFAAEEGDPYYPARDAIIAETPGMVIVTEGTLDLKIVATVLSRFAAEKRGSYHLVSANGVLNTVNVARFILDAGSAKKVVAVLDDDKAGRTAEKELKTQFGERADVIVSRPYLDRTISRQIEEHFGSYQRYRMMSYAARREFVEAAVKSAPEQQLLNDPIIRRILEAIKYGGQPPEDD
jgi:Restriction endonuclease/Toprim-like